MSLSYNNWLHFQTATAQTGPCFFLYRFHLIWPKQSVLGRALPSFAGVGKKKTSKICWMHSCSFLCNISNFIFKQEQPYFFLHWLIPYEKPYNIALQIYFLAHTSLFFIKSNVIKLDTSQKAYSVNKGFFLGVFSLPQFAYMGRYWDAIYCVLVNYVEVFYDLRY